MTSNHEKRVVCRCHCDIWDYKANEAKSAPLNGVNYKQPIESKFECYILSFFNSYIIIGNSNYL